MFCFLDIFFYCDPNYDKLLCDEMTCEQMRDSGWTEEEIKEFMAKHGGYYCNPE
jgi:site-specific DNA-adenine methylase